MSRRRPRLFELVLFCSTALALTFLLLPLVAIFLRVPLRELVSQLGSGVAVDALVVTLETNLVAQALVLLVGTPTAYFIASKRFRGRAAAITLIELPLVLPPAVAGLALLAAFGRLGLLGGTFEALGLTVSFTKAAVVLAVHARSSLRQRRQCATHVISKFCGEQPLCLQPGDALIYPARTRQIAFADAFHLKRGVHALHGFFVQAFRDRDISLFEVPPIFELF